MANQPVGQAIDCELCEKGMFALQGHRYKDSTVLYDVGMRLEAVDKANPSLICVATISE